MTSWHRERNDNDYSSRRMPSHRFAILPRRVHGICTIRGYRECSWRLGTVAGSVERQCGLDEIWLQERSQGNERIEIMLLAYAPLYYAGGGFPWGLLIIGVIAYFAWRNGFFDSFGRRGGPPYGGFGPGRDQGNAQPLRGPRAEFDEWHRQAHEAERTQAAGPFSPPAAPSPGAS